VPVYAPLATNAPSQVGDMLIYVVVINAVRTPGNQHHEEDRVGGARKSGFWQSFLWVLPLLSTREQKGAALALDELRQSEMMNHLLDALDKREDIGHYGRLTFAMVAHHFLDREELVAWLAKDGDTDENGARALVQQAEERGYNPPKRERILEWQEQQDFPICPNSDDPDACNVYRELNLPDEVFENIQEYQEKRQAADA
jgi:hypothetical protein